LDLSLLHSLGDNHSCHVWIILDSSDVVTLGALRFWPIYWPFALLILYLMMDKLSITQGE
jgi:hypothetical protein